jgi:hypothetical protein
MSQIKSFRDLMVWQKGMDLGVGTLKLAKLLPRDEQMSLGHQLRKSAISIPSNIAEGFSRRVDGLLHSTPVDFACFWGGATDPAASGVAGQPHW